LFLFSVPAGDRITVVSYSVLTLLIAGLLSLIRGGSPSPRSQTGDRDAQEQLIVR
jgi:hypothetical protein